MILYLQQESAINQSIISSIISITCHLELVFSKACTSNNRINRLRLVHHTDMTSNISDATNQLRQSLLIQEASSQASSHSLCYNSPQSDNGRNPFLFVSLLNHQSYPSIKLHDQIIIILHLVPH